MFGESLALLEYKRSQRDEKVFHQLSAARPPQVAVVAVARELVGFRWAVMRDAPEPLGYLPPANTKRSIAPPARTPLRWHSSKPASEKLGAIPFW